MGQCTPLTIFLAETRAFWSERDSHHPVSFWLGLSLSSLWAGSVVSLSERNQEVGDESLSGPHFSLQAHFCQLLPCCSLVWASEDETPDLRFQGSIFPAFQLFLFLLKNKNKGRTIERQKNWPQTTLFTTAKASGSWLLFFWRRCPFWCSFWRKTE